MSAQWSRGTAQSPICCEGRHYLYTTPVFSSECNNNNKHLRCATCLCVWFAGRPLTEQLKLRGMDELLEERVKIAKQAFRGYDLFAVSVVGCLLGYSSCLVVWIPLFLDPSDGVFGRFDLAALCGCRTLNFCLFVCLISAQSRSRAIRLC